MTIRMKVALLALLSLLASDSMTRPAEANDGALTLTIENDTFTKSDSNYTNGIGISWVSAPLGSYDNGSVLNKWGRLWAFLPFISDDGYSTYAAWSFVQEMHTPDEIKNPNPPEDDQPYAGILYVDSLLYARKERWGHSWELKLGVVGPASQADHTQTEFHELIGADVPQGWHTQLPNEPVINLGYTAAYLAAAGNAGGSAEWRIVPVGTVGIGTYFTGAGIGLYGEVGWNLVDAFGITSLRTGLNAASTVGVGRVDGWSVALFGGIGGYGIIHYLPLDGTVFRDSRSVDSEPFVGMTSLGFCVRHGRFTLSYALTYFTKTFETERDNHDFGTVSISWFL